jgi:hypothetical protein
VDATGSETLMRGTILKNATTNITGNGDGTAYELGAVTATERVYAAVHIHAVDGGTVAVKIQSDDNEGMASATDRITFSTSTGVTSQWKELAGPVTDTWWRANWTYAGTACQFVVVMMIT